MAYILTGFHRKCRVDESGVHVAILAEGAKSPSDIAGHLQKS